jgi:hypothetical protein
MRKTLALLVLAACAVPLSAASGQAPGGARIRDILPLDGLVGSSVVAVRDQAELNAHYYLADETILELGRKTDAIFARYRTDGRDALVLAIAYPSGADAARVHGRFGHDFFSKDFDPKERRYLEKLETGDWAGTARRGPCLIVVLEAPDRKTCDDLLRRAEEKARELFKENP